MMVLSQAIIPMVTKPKCKCFPAFTVVMTPRLGVLQRIVRPGPGNVIRGKPQLECGLLKTFQNMGLDYTASCIKLIIHDGRFTLIPYETL